MRPSYLDQKSQAIDANRCIYSGCTNEPDEDSLLCKPHHADHNRRQRVSKRRRKEFRRRQLVLGGMR